MKKYKKAKSLTDTVTVSFDRQTTIDTHLCLSLKRGDLSILWTEQDDLKHEVWEALDPKNPNKRCIIERNFNGEDSEFTIVPDFDVVTYKSI